MRKLIVMAGLLAATSAIPAMAQRGEWRDRGMQPQAERTERPARAERQQRDFGQQQAQAPQQAQAQVQAQAPRAEWQGRRSGGQDAGAQAWQGRRGFGGQTNVPGVTVQQQAQAPVQYQGRAGGFSRYDRNADGRADVRVDRNTGQYDRNANRRYDRSNGVRVERYNGGRGDARYGGNVYSRNGYARQGYAGNWNRDWRNDNRYNWQSYRTYNRGLYNLPRYYAPYGWNYGYQRFSIGVALNSLLFAQNYWIDDPYQYRLPEAYPPYRWVRYYNDALLIDERSGYVVDAQYDFFW